MEIINGLPLNEIDKALENYPVPYVVAASAGGGPTVVDNKKAGSPLRLDVDQSLATGKGGHDIEIEVNTELLPTPHLRLDIVRIGGPPFVQDLQVIVAFPFDAFNTEDGTLPGDPNLFFGYQTTAAFDGSGYSAGGIAPQRVTYRFTPDVLAGTSHLFTVSKETVGASNPIRFLAGHFDGSASTGILNATAFGTLADPVPATIEMSLDTDESGIDLDPSALTDSALGISWTSSSPAKVVFDYLENESFPFTTPDYGTTLTFEQMPTSESILLHLDEDARTLDLEHDANAPIGKITLRHERADGLSITGTATDVPTQVDLTLDLAGSAELDVNANTLDLQLVAEQEGGFFDTDGFLAYEVGYASVGVANAPDLTAAYDPAEDTFSVAATNPGESIGAVELVIGDDGNLELPPSWADVPTHHIFSLVDDGSAGTAAARIVHLTEGTIDLNAIGDDIGPEEIYDLVLGEAAPLQAYLRTQPGSTIVPGHDIEATCDVDDVPAGTIHLDIDFPTDFEYSVDPPTGIDSVHCFGHLDTLNFDVLGEDLPPFLDWEYDADAGVTLRAQQTEALPNSASVGALAVRLWDGVGLGIPGTGALLGTPLQEGRFRVDDTPSFTGTWSDGPGSTAYEFDTGVPNAGGLFLGGAQFGASTEVDLPAPVAASPTATDYARFRDAGTDGAKQISAGVFGIDLASYSSTDAPRDVSVSYDANADHPLFIDVDTTFGGRFFPGNDVDAFFLVDDIPESFDLTTDLATRFDYTASDGIDSVSLDASIDITDDSNAGNTTDVDLLVEGLPAAVSLVVDPALDPDGNVTFTMASPIDTVDLLVTGAEGIFGSSLKQIDLEIDHIPANWQGSWTDSGGSITAVGDKVDLISLIVSTALPAGNAGMRSPFTTGGGSVSYSDWLREIDRRWARTGVGAADDREADFMPRLDDIYDSTTNLAEDEDRVLYRNDGGSFKYLEFRLSDLQGASFSASSGAASATLNVPFDNAPEHPFYVGMAKADGDFTTVQIADLPDTLTLDAVDGNPGHVHFDGSAALGRVDVYDGPLPAAGDGATVTKAIVPSLPASMHLDWSFGDPGNASFTASDEIEVRFLRQDGSSRIVSVVDFQNLSLNYGTQTGGLTTGECFDPDLIGPLPEICNVYYRVIEASASFTASPGIDGMLLVYDHDSAVEANGISPSDDGEYEPLLSFLLEDLTSISGSAGIRVCLTPTGLPPCPPGAIFPFLGFGISGTANLDFWDDGGGPADILGDPDYVSNNPWNLIPLLYDEDDRINPFD